MDKESATLFKVLLWGFAAIVAFLFWAALTETRETIGLLVSNLA